MSRKYFVWKDPACGGVNIEWVELTGKEFHAMMELPENKKQRFVRLGNEDFQDTDIIIIEANQDVYRKWKNERKRQLYRIPQKKNVMFRSMDELEDGGDDSLSL